MAGANKVLLTISAVDNASTVVEGLTSVIHGSGVAAIALGNIFADVFTGSIVTSINVASSAVRGFTRLIEDTASLQLGNITAASNYAAVSGATFEHAQGITLEIRKSLANIASDLPGVTSDYTANAASILDDIAQASKDAGGAINETAFKGNIIEATKGLTLLQATSPMLQMEDVQRFAMRFFGGGTLRELEQLGLMEQSATFRNKLTEQLGGRELQSLTQPEKLDTLLKALKASNLEELAQKAGQSLSGFWQDFISKITDPDAGLFGFLRDLDPLLEGEQTIAESLTGSYKALFSESDSLVVAVTNLSKSLGLSDPLLFLKGQIEQFTASIREVTQFIKQLTPDGGKASGQDLGLAISRIMNEFSHWFSRAYWRAVDFLGSTDYRQFVANLDVGAIASTLATLVNLGLTAINEFFHVFFANGNWLKGLVGFMSNLDWGAVVKVMLNVLTLSLIGGILALGSIILGVLSGWFVSAVVGAILVSFVGVPAGIAGIIAAIVGFVVGPILAPIVGAFAGFLAASVLAIIQWSARKIAGLARSFGAAWNGLDRVVRGFFAESYSKIRNWGASLLEAVGNFFGGIIDWLAQLPVVGGAFRLATAAPPARRLTAPAATAPSAAKGTWWNPLSWFGGNRATGNFPDGFGSILGALLSEVDLMPSGAQAVIANTSELILNRDQQGGLVDRILSGGSTFTGAPLSSSPRERVADKGATHLTVHNTFNISTNNPQDFNQQVMAVLSNQWGQYLQTMLVSRNT